MIPLEALQVLDSIDRKGSFAAAAEELYRVPSAITYTVKKLEEQLNIKLFDRDRQRAQLTPTGRLVLEKGRHILQQVQQLEEQARLAENGWEKQLRVVVDTILPCEPFWPLVMELQQEQPWLDIKIMDEALSGSWEALSDDRADLIIGVSGDEPLGGHYQKVPLGNMSAVLCCSPSHPAASLVAPIEHEQLSRYTHIVVSDSARHIMQRSVGMIGIQRTLAVNNLSQKISALLDGAGISHLPSYIATPLIQQQRLVALNTSSTPTATPFFMAWKKQGTGKANQWLREAIIQRDILAHIIK